MKRLITVLMILTAGIYISAQVVPGGEKYMDKYNVQSITVNERTFKVGDTLIFDLGSGQNGDFISTKLAPMLMGTEIVHLDAQYAGYKFIISKIRHVEAGLNNSTTIVFMLPKNQKQLNSQTADVKGVPVWIDLKLALLIKEIK